MTSLPPTNSISTSPPRPVLIWQEEGEASHVKPTVEQAAEFLHVPVDSVLAAISSGDVLDGWFVDWEASEASSG